MASKLQSIQAAQRARLNQRFNRTVPVQTQTITLSPENTTQQTVEERIQVKTDKGVIEVTPLAYEKALKHFNKGMAGAYLFHIKPKDAHQRQVTALLEQFVKDQRRGKLNPTGTELAKQRYKNYITEKLNYIKQKKTDDNSIQTIGS